jgi:predicted deacylase
MQTFPQRWVVAGALSLVVLGIGTFIFLRTQNVPPPVVTTPTTTPEKTTPQPLHEVIGKSVQGRDIEAYTYGTGGTHLLFVGGMHGGYEWNSVLLAYEAMDYLSAHPEAIPKTLAVTIVPSANPDGVYKVLGKAGRFTFEDIPSDTGPIGTGRFNADNVDLNRNFDCHWQPMSTWRGNEVSAGTSPFSEPESKAIRDLVLKDKPAAVVFWHSQADAVYASECDSGVLSGTVSLMNTYADAAGYPAVKSFDAYPVTGDSEGWLASIGIPAVTVELSTHNTTEWSKNLAGIEALFALYGGKSTAAETSTTTALSY